MRGTPSFANVEEELRTLVGKSSDAVKEVPPRVAEFLHARIGKGN